MKLSVKKVNGTVFHRVVPETGSEVRLAVEFLWEENNGIFSDGGHGIRWRKFVDAMDRLRMETIASKIIELFDGKEVTGKFFKKMA